VGPFCSFRVQAFDFLDISLETAARSQFERMNSHSCANFGIGEFYQGLSQGMKFVSVRNDTALATVR
jgi:hypothetical protein